MNLSKMEVNDEAVETKADIPPLKPLPAKRQRTGTLIDDDADVVAIEDMLHDIGLTVYGWKDRYDARGFLYYAAVQFDQIMDEFVADVSRKLKDTYNVSSVLQVD